jgi:glyoxylase-like metal-dependent hydrolase (beta-lactamase superfamily II)
VSDAAAPGGAWSELGEGVWVRQSRAYAMNSVVLIKNGHAVVVDPGVLPSELDDLSQFVTSRVPDFDRVAVIFTHPHWDHVIGKPWFPAATLVGHVGFADEIERDADDIERKAKAYIEGEGGEAWRTPFAPFVPDLQLRGTVGHTLGPFPFLSYDIPGHSASQIAVQFPEQGLFLSADTLSDIEIPWLDAPAWIHRKSLESLQRVFEHEHIEVLVPGHGSVARGRAAVYQRVLNDIAYLRKLEERVSQAFKEGLTVEQTQERLAQMDYLGKDAAYAMNDVHRGNVRFTWQGLAERA